MLVVGKDSEEKPKAKSKTASLNLDENFFDFAQNAEQIRKQSLERIGFYEQFNAASNNFVVSGKRTLDGKPILANDPHLQASAPSIWYLVNLSSPGNRVAGVTFPGVPGVVLGHNEFIAWGATNLGPDVQDLYIEEFNDKKENKTANGFKPSKIRTEEIKGSQKSVRNGNGNRLFGSYRNRRRRDYSGQRREKSRSEMDGVRF